MATKKKTTHKATKKKPVPEVTPFPEVLYVRRYEEDDWGEGPYFVHHADLGTLLNDDTAIVAEYHLAAVGEAVRTVGISFNRGE